MGILYERIVELCKEKGIKPATMCRELGISQNLPTELKAGRKKSVKAKTAVMIADYFGVTVGYLLGEEPRTTTEVLRNIKSPTSEEIGPVKQALLKEINDYSEEEAALLLARARKIKESR